MTQSQHQRSPSPPRSNTAHPTSPSARTPYSKRHASFNSPREVPLPSPSVVSSESVYPFFSSSAKPLDLDSQSSPSVSPQHTPLPFGQFCAHDVPPPSQLPKQQINMKLTQEDSLIASRRQKRNHSRQPSLGPNSAIASQLADNLHLDHSVPSSTPAAAESTTIYPARPSSLAETYSLSYSSTLQNSMLAMPTSLDRYSSSSLPLPSQIPFYALPKANPPPNHTSSSTQTPASELSQPSPVEMHSGSSFPVPPNRPGLRCPSVNSQPTSSSSSSSSSSSRSQASVATSNSSLHSESSPQKLSPAPLSPSRATSESQQLSSAPVTRPESQPAPRPISPFRAPRPPPPQPRTPALEGTAMRRYMTPSQLQSASPLSGTALNSPSLASASAAAAFSTTSVMALLTSDQYPPPEPPTILPPDPSHDVTEESEMHNQAPYMPFLSQVLPPPDSWIEVETMRSEYRLLVRLPGFSREGITLASKRRRILHIVADSWENGGGHFERRISFGYDADLAQVRAEFDGVMLRIAIPRRVSPITWNANASSRRA